MQTKRYDVFISYSSHDQKIAEGVCGYLERKGYRCFVAYRDIPRGVVWAGAITDAIDASKMMVVVFSENFNRSSQTDREIELASENGMPILTFRITKAAFTGAKKYYLKNLNWIDAFPKPEQCFGELHSSVSKLIGKPGEKKVGDLIDDIAVAAVEVEPPAIHRISEKRTAEQHKVGGKTLSRQWWYVVYACVAAVVVLAFALALGSRQETESPKAEDSYSGVDASLSPVIQTLMDNMVYVEGGTFTMGATLEQGNDAESYERPAHQVTLSAFSIGRYEVTQEEWAAVMGDNPSYFKGDKRPVECVSWDDCQVFLRKLNELTGKQFRLPTEAEWEFAARGGKFSRVYKFAGNNNLRGVAWFKENSFDKGESSPDYGTHPVGQKQANELGLHDMSGNVWEWCSDYYGDYASQAQTDPEGASSGSGRVFRGGSWDFNAAYCRTAYRDGYSPGFRSNFLGFRLAL